jgi:hypothetical protein
MKRYLKIGREPDTKSHGNRQVLGDFQRLVVCCYCHDSARTLGFISLKSGGTITNLTAMEYGRGQRGPGL